MGIFQNPNMFAHNKSIAIWSHLLKSILLCREEIDRKPSQKAHMEMMMVSDS